jgi:hypothetical protein
MSMEEVVFLSTHILQQTKKHALYCGGKSEFVVIRNTGELRGISTITALSRSKMYSDRNR